MGRIVLFVLMFAATACAAEEPTVSQPPQRQGHGHAPGHSEPPPPPRDGQAAIQQEFDATAKADTLAAWDLFLSRHPDNELTERARTARAALLDARP
jgi:hypothetical protein